jgi:hypothetical protein
MNSNPFAVAARASDFIQVATSKDAQEIQAALVVAKKYPRDQHQSFQRIMDTCKRKSLAEEASYLYARGGTQITGPSIRLLEAIAVAWGNIQSGVIELQNENGESRVQCYAWDIESNTYDAKTFTVRHERHTREGTVKLTDPRDTYELVANFAARRKRACLEAVIPRDIIEAAVEQCDLTLKSGQTEPITDRIRKMTTAFAEFGVSVEMLERRLQHKLDACIEQELVILRKIYTSLKDGMGKREDFFDLTAQPKTAKFDPETEAKEQKAEAEAGLAPAQRTEPPQPVMTPQQERMARARAARKAAGEGAAATTEPAAQEPTAPAPAAAAAQAGTPQPVAAAPAPAPSQAPSPTEPAPVEKAPPPVAAPAPAATPAPVPTPASAPVAPTAQPADLFSPPAGEPTERQLLESDVVELLGTNKVTEAEVLFFLKSRKICPDSMKALAEASDAILIDLIENIAGVAAQCRINRRAAKK